MTYRIVDEPAPSGLSNYAVSPLAPLFGIIILGAVVIWPWFAFNSIAFGSATRRKELLLCAVAALGGLALALVLVLISHRVPEWTHPYLALVYVAWKVGFGYTLTDVQTRSFELYEHYGGRVRSGALAFFVVLLIYMLIRVAIPFSQLPEWVRVGLL